MRTYLKLDGSKAHDFYGDRADEEAGRVGRRQDLIAQSFLICPQDLGGYFGEHEEHDLFVVEYAPRSGLDEATGELLMASKSPGRFDVKGRKLRALRIIPRYDRQESLVTACRVNSWAVTVGRMSGLRARVEKGRLILDEPTTLPEGTVVDLVADDDSDDLTDEERRTLHEALSASWQSAEAGRLRPVSAILDELRQRR